MRPRKLATHIATCNSLQKLQTRSDRLPLQHVPPGCLCTKAVPSRVHRLPCQQPAGGCIFNPPLTPRVCVQEGCAQQGHLLPCQHAKPTAGHPHTATQAHGCRQNTTGQQTLQHSTAQGCCCCWGLPTTSWLLRLVLLVLPADLPLLLLLLLTGWPRFQWLGCCCQCPPAQLPRAPLPAPCCSQCYCVSEGNG